MNMSKKEELRQKVRGTNFHLNLEDGAELTEEITEDVLKFINFVKEKNENERS